MRTKRYWDNRYQDFCDKVLGEEIRLLKLDMDAIKDEITSKKRFYRESIENDQATPEEIVLYCYINHELNLLDPIGMCYPSISNEYSNYAWDMVESLLKEGRDQFPFQLKKQLKDLHDSSINFNTEWQVFMAICRKITKIINEIYSSLEYIKDLHKEQFSESLFWEKQFTNFQYKTLAKKRKEYASSITFLQEEREDLIEHKKENMTGKYEDFVQFLYVNHHLNLLDLTNMYYPQFHYQYEKYAWEILHTYKNSSEIEFLNEAKKMIVGLYEEEEEGGWKRKQDSIQFHIMKIQKELFAINK